MMMIFIRLLTKSGMLFLLCLMFDIQCINCTKAHSLFAKTKAIKLIILINVLPDFLPAFGSNDCVASCLDYI